MPDKDDSAHQSVPHDHTQTAQSPDQNVQAPAPVINQTVSPEKVMPQTNLLAVLSLVFAFLFNIVGLILGIISLKQIKNTGEQGKGIAIAGIVISAISIFITILTILLLSLGVIAGFNAYQDCVENGGTNCELDSSSTDDKPPKDSSSDVVAVDTYANAGELRVKVNSVKEYDGGDFNKPNQGNIYLNIELEIENDGFDTRNISGIYASIKDDENNKYNESFVSVPQGSPTIDGELPSKQTVKGIVGFEVAKDAKGLVLQFESGKFDGKNAHIDLGR